METTGTAGDRPGVGRFAGLMDRWRRSQGLRDTAFAASLGLPKSAWSHVKHGARPVPRAMAARVLAQADEPWRSGFEKALAQDLVDAARGASPTDTA